MIRIKSFESYESNHPLMEYFQDLVDDGYKISIGEDWMGNHSETSIRIDKIPLKINLFPEGDPKISFKEVLSIMLLNMDEPHEWVVRDGSILNELKDTNFIKQIENTSDYELHEYQFYNVRDFRGYLNDKCDLVLRFVS